MIFRILSGYDCPPLENLYDFIAVIAGGSVAGAKALVSGSVDVAVNFCGGWHHAQRDGASGFCYVNDCTVMHIIQLSNSKIKQAFFIARCSCHTRIRKKIQTGTLH